MDIKPLDIPDAWACTPRQFGDDRGVFLEWFRADLLAEATGRSFDSIQANHSVSRRGVLRGVHYADVPPGQAKFVYCVRGAILDVIVDIRAGSPTYGAHCAVRLDDVDRKSVVIAEGIGHAYLVLSESADVTYLVTTPYNPTAEHELNPLDPALDLPWHSDATLADGARLLSPKDAAAPTLADALAAGRLPSYDDCRAHYERLRLPD